MKVTEVKKLRKKTEIKKLDKLKNKIKQNWKET